MSLPSTPARWIVPPRLRPGDTVAVPTPSGPVPPERFRAGLELLAQRYNVRVDEAAFAATGYLAGNDDRRADELNRYLADPDVRAILVGRGGYGLMRIVQRLDRSALRADPKPIVGFSDATVLLAWALEVGVRPIHGPVVNQLSVLTADDRAELFRVLEQPLPPAPFIADSGLAPLGCPPPSVSGHLLGGNLCIISNLVGTPYQLDTRGAVLLLEEVGERPYAIDRYLTHLALAGAFDGCRAAVVGDLVRCEELSSGTGPGALEVVRERLASVGVPALSGLPVGHGQRNRALPLGARVVLDERGLVVLDAAVA